MRKPSAAQIPTRERHLREPQSPCKSHKSPSPRSCEESHKITTPSHPGSSLSCFSSSVDQRRKQRSTDILQHTFVFTVTTSANHNLSATGFGGRDQQRHRTQNRTTILHFRHKERKKEMSARFLIFPLFR